MNNNRLNLKKFIIIQSVYDSGNDSHYTLTMSANSNVNIEYPL